MEMALRRGQQVRCAYCQQMGATSGCHRLRCTNIYHFTCALDARCTFFNSQTAATNHMLVKLIPSGMMRTTRGG